MSRSVRVLPPALGDLRRITQRIEEQVSSASSAKWARLLQNAASDLSESAESHPEANEAADLGIPLRMRIVGRRPQIYRIIYTFSDEFVFVHRIRHAAQDRLTADEL